MSETLGSLCDKLSIVSLKIYHTEGESIELIRQSKALQSEIDGFLGASLRGEVESICFPSHKVYKKQGNTIPAQSFFTIGKLCGELAMVNCKIWHVQEHVYDFERVPQEQKNGVIKQLAVLNLQRNQHIDAIDRCFKEILTK